MAQPNKEIGREWQGGAIPPIMVTRASGLWREKKLNKKRQKVVKIDTRQGTALGNDEWQGECGVPVDRILVVVMNVVGDRAIVEGGQTTWLGEVLV